MLMLKHLLFFIEFLSVNSHYILYSSNIHSTSSKTFDCLYGYIVESGKEIGRPFIQTSNLIPYCRRLDHHEQVEDFSPPNQNIAKQISFKELKERKISSEQLLQWFVPIDLAESYQMNLTNDWEIFYNCSSPWFGSHCQYRFSDDFSRSVGDRINAHFLNTTHYSMDITDGTCYTFIDGCENNSWPLCLDWREVCDGKMDCFNGKDEEGCDQLEVTECGTDEYRCHYGGQCIPKSFFYDNRLAMDCLDGSDEVDSSDYHLESVNAFCSKFSTFRCQERTPRYHWLFPCGDGQYLFHLSAPIGQVACSNKRDTEFVRSLFSSLDHISDDHCRKSFSCALYRNRRFTRIAQVVDVQTGTYKNIESVIIDGIWQEEDCEALSKHCLSEWLVIPAQPIFYRIFQFVYFTNRTVQEFQHNIAPDIVCFQSQQCPVLLKNIISIDLIAGLTCTHISYFTKTDRIKDFESLTNYFYLIDEECFQSGVDISCSNSSHFYCEASKKCIPLHRVGDGFPDCLGDEDEIFDACQFNDSNRLTCDPNYIQCLMPVADGNPFYKYNLFQPESHIYLRNSNEQIPFPSLCNRNLEGLSPNSESFGPDETDCDLWPCDNPYTQCDGLWQCINGVDELNCPDNPCLSNEYKCFIDDSHSFYCLPKSQLYSKYIPNCANAANLKLSISFYNRTENLTAEYYSWNSSKCIYDQLCRDRHHYHSATDEYEWCSYESPRLFLSSIRNVYYITNNEYLCSLKTGEERAMDSYDYIDRQKAHFFLSNQLGYFPPISVSQTTAKTTFNSEKIPSISSVVDLYCNRGISVLTNEKNETVKCFCPPNYFGSRCQWQNQRISLTLQFIWRSATSKSVIFQAVIMLIDEDGRIEPYHEQVTYVPNRDCNTKFHIYLLYPDRPKSSSKTYSIRIDLFEKMKFVYWTSWILSIPFSFLPVNRISTPLFIPELEEIEKCLLSCGEESQCRHYVNRNASFFCERKSTECQCSDDSICLSSSICVCPLEKFGRYCHLTRSICHLPNNPCQNKGVCIPLDDRIDRKGFTCVCPDDYSGERCQNSNNRIDVHINETILSNTTLILLHLITAFDNAEHERRIVLKKKQFHHENLVLYVGQVFHILLVEIPDQNYYLAILRERFVPSEYIFTSVQPNQRCSSVSELNKTLSEYEYLNRVKFYPLICRENPQLTCFYDNYLMCICDSKRFSNCFSFNKSVTNDCEGTNYCQNDGRCFHNNQTCPTRFTCICPDCFYGSKCQFSTAGFLFSLDAILGYHVQTNISIDQQPFIIKFSIVISTILFVIGFLSGFLSLMTFRQKSLRKVGCGNYLFVSSICTLIMTIILTWKFWHLILTQSLSTTNEPFLKLSYMTLDVSLSIFSTVNDWLDVCVAIERMVSVMKGTRFNKKQSRKASKWVIIGIFLLIIFTNIHDPIHRELIEDIDIDEKRIWCFVRYSPSVEIYNTFVNMFHVLSPFFINIVSSLWIIVCISRNHRNVHPDQTFAQHFKAEISRHRNILIAPFLLILLVLPRLIISFASGCMRSARQPWLYLFGYFASFIPSMLIFILFVLPSKTYKKEFNTAVRQTIRQFSRRMLDDTL